MSVLDECVRVYCLLEQADAWIDANGRRHQIDEMSVRYKANVVAFLERRAARLADFYGYGELIDYSRHPAGGEMAQDAVESALADADRARMEQPVEWLRGTRLVRRLLADVDAGRGGEDD